MRFWAQQQQPSTLIDRLRARMLAQIQRETPAIARMQQRWRSPLLDLLFVHIFTALGTHTMFLISLPILFWFGDARFARYAPNHYSTHTCSHLTLMVGTGAVMTTLFKDLFCLPRPFAPPVKRLLHKENSYHQHEYGLPSTHACNSASIALFTLWYFMPTISTWPSMLQFIVYALTASYAIFLPLSRVYCGMHSFSDITFGSVLGAAVTLIHLRFFFHPLESWIVGAAFHPSLTQYIGITIGAMAVLVYVVLAVVHSDPHDPCPCFDDATCFAAVFMGLVTGSARLAAHRMHVFEFGPKYLDANLSMTDRLTTSQQLARLVFGVAVLILWRSLAKTACQRLLTPVWTAKKWPLKLYAQSMDKAGKKTKFSHRCRPVMLHRTSLEFATKFLVYAGIGWLAVDGIPSLFTLLSL